MKIEPLFTVKDNQLYTISGQKQDVTFIDVLDVEKIPANVNGFYKLTVEQKIVEPDIECYNEEYLANLRNVLKSFENSDIFVVLDVVPAKLLENSINEDFENYVACVKHITRRLKDCSHLIGIYFNAEFVKNDADNLKKVDYVIEELNVKHAQYVYFLEASKINSEYLEKIVVV